MKKCKITISVSVARYTDTACDIQWWRWQRGIHSVWHFPEGRHFKEDKKFWPVYSHLNALQFSISSHHRCSVTFKMHQIHFRPGIRPRLTLRSSPYSIVGWELWGKEGRHCNRQFCWVQGIWTINIFYVYFTPNVCMCVL